MSQRSGESNIIAYVHRFVEEFCVPSKKSGHRDANYTANENSTGMNTNDCQKVGECDVYFFVTLTTQNGRVGRQSGVVM